MGTSRQTMDFLLDQLERSLPVTTRKSLGSIACTGTASRWRLCVMTSCL